MRIEFLDALKAHEASFGVELSASALEGLADFYELIQQHNPLLHLVAPCTPKDFAVRHVLESLTLLEVLPRNARFADVGTGAGLPSIPCLILRDDLIGFLIESKAKKIGFLKEVVAECGFCERASLIHRQFSESPRPDVSYVTCRALDRFAQNLPRLMKWSGDGTLLLFGGPSLQEQLITLGVKFTQKLMPMSEQRYLFVATHNEK